MKIYTSYYAKIARVKEPAVLIRISTSKPDWFPKLTIDMKDLYPGWDLVNDIKKGLITWEEYTQRYQEKLSRLDKERILDELRTLAERYDPLPIVLLCYERPTDNCHRHLVADWLDCDVEELTDELN